MTIYVGAGLGSEALGHWGTLTQASLDPVFRRNNELEFMDGRFGSGQAVGCSSLRLICALPAAPLLSIHLFRSSRQGRLRVVCSGGVKCACSSTNVTTCNVKRAAGGGCRRRDESEEEGVRRL
jgi:hypothetical protein